MSLDPRQTWKLVYNSLLGIILLLYAACACRVVADLAPLLMIPIAAGLTAGAIAWALFGDAPPLGWVRCPRCLYDLRYLPEDKLTCPECGRVAGSLAELGRTRRHWGRAAVAPLISVSCFVSADLIGDYHAIDWGKIAPDVVLVHAAPLESTLAGLRWELEHRARRGELGNAASTMLFSRLDRLCRGSTDDTTWARAATLAFSHRGDWTVSKASYFETLARNSPICIDRGAALYRLTDVEPSRPCNAEVLRAMLGDTCPDCRRRAAFVLVIREIGLADDALADLASDAVLDADPWVRERALEFMGWMTPERANVLVPVLVRAAASGDERDRVTAIRSLGNMRAAGREALTAIDAISSAPASSEPVVRAARDSAAQIRGAQ